MTSRHRVDLRNDSIHIEVPKHFEPSSTRAASFVLARSADTSFGFHMTGDTLRAEIAIGGTIEMSIQLGLDRVAYRHLRMREAAGTLFFETSADGDTWVAFASGDTPYYAGAVRIQILAVDSPTTDDTIAFDGLNAGRDAASWCKSSGFEDPFDDGSFDGKWIALAPTPACDSISESNVAVIQTSSNPPNASECELRTANVYDLTESMVEIEVGSISDTELVRYVSVTGEEGSFFGISHSDEGLCSYLFDGNNGNADFRECIVDGFRPHWRIRNVGANVVLEVSSDRSVWDLVVNRPRPYATDAVDFSLGVLTIGQSSGGAFELRHFNQTP